MLFLNEEILNKDTNTIIIFGYSIKGKIIANQIKSEYPNINIAFCDNSSYKQGVHLDGTVLSVDAAVESSDTYTLFTLGSFLYKSSMLSQLSDLGVREDKILNVDFSHPCFNDMYETERIAKITPLNKIKFEMDISEHCNLNCAYCSTFSPLSQELYYDIVNYENDLKRMGQLFNGEARKIHLIGGEPLLNKNINEYVKITRKYFPKAEQIIIFTNGILLFKQDDIFWDVVKQTNTEISVTKYPINIDYNKMKSLVESHNIKFHYIGDSESFKYMRILAVDALGSQDIEDSFRNCSEPNKCIKLKNGKLFKCVRPSEIFKFNEYFHRDIQLEEGDYIDIYKAKDANEILEYLANGPIPFCKYCDMRGRLTDHEWKQSKKEISEWTYQE